jgi:translocation and assembly module TamB
LTFDFALPIAHADLYGMELGATRFAGRWTGSLVTVEPIQTTLNGGRLMLRPEVDLEAEGGPVVRLGAGAAIRDARINDEVSRRVLSYVAPVLNQATQVNGTVSADLSSAVFPLVRAVGRKATVEGLVVFDDVTFGAGPLSRELLSLVIRDPGKLEQARLVIDQPVRLAIAEGRIEQHGLGLAVGNLARIELDGWVDFERNLALEASIPLNPELFPKVPLLNGVVRATRFRIPIGGTLDQPRVDGTAMKEGLSKLGQDVLQETAARGLVELFSAIGRPRDPNAVPKPPAPRLTPQERKAMRQEKQAERKRARSPRP